MLRISTLIAALSLLTTTLSAQGIVGGPVRTLSDTSVASAPGYSFRSNFGAPVIALGSGSDILVTWEQKAQKFSPGLQPVGQTIRLEGWTRDPVLLPDGGFMLLEGLQTAPVSPLYIWWSALRFDADGSGRRVIRRFFDTERIEWVPNLGWNAAWTWSHQQLPSPYGIIACLEHDEQYAAPTLSGSMRTFGETYMMATDTLGDAVRMLHRLPMFAMSTSPLNNFPDTARYGVSLHRIDARNGAWVYYSREQILDSSDISRFRRSFCIQPLGADTLSPSIDLGIVDGVEYTRTEEVLLQENGDVLVVCLFSTLSHLTIERFSSRGILLQKKGFEFPAISTESIFTVHRGAMGVEAPVYHRADLAVALLPGNRLAIAWTQQRENEDPRILLRILGSDLEWETSERLLANPYEGKLTLPFLATRNDTLFCAWMTERNSDGALIPSLKVVTADQVLATNDPPLADNTDLTLDIRPMPVTDRCIVNMYNGSPIGTFTEQGTLVVSDLLGRVMLLIPASTGESWIPLDTSGLRPGCYLLRWVTTNGKHASRLFVKQ